MFVRHHAIRRLKVVLAENKCLTQWGQVLVGQYPIALERSVRLTKSTASSSDD
jgi:hypothetical protein